MFSIVRVKSIWKIKILYLSSLKKNIFHTMKQLLQISNLFIIVLYSKDWRIQSLEVGYNLSFECLLLQWNCVVILHGRHERKLPTNIRGWIHVSLYVLNLENDKFSVGSIDKAERA